MSLYECLGSVKNFSQPLMIMDLRSSAAFCKTGIVLYLLECKSLFFKKKERLLHKVRSGDFLGPFSASFGAGFKVESPEAHSSKTQWSPKFAGILSSVGVLKIGRYLFSSTCKLTRFTIEQISFLALHPFYFCTPGLSDYEWLCSICDGRIVIYLICSLRVFPIHLYGVDIFVFQCGGTYSM